MIQKISRKILDNGIRIVSENISYINSCSIVVVVNTGARDESKSDSGYSHFIEHMLFKGTKKRSSLEIANTLEKKGGYINAMTGYENTWIEAKCLTEDLPTALELIGDMLSGSLFTEKAIENEKKVIYQEIKSVQDTPEELVFDYFFSNFFGSHPMGTSIFGSLFSLRNMTRSKLLNFYRKHYTYDNIIIGVAGNIKSNINKLVEENFLLRKGRNKKRIPVEKTNKGKTIHRRNRIKQIQLVIGGRSFSTTSDKRYHMQVIMNIIGGGLSSRLFQLLREKKPMVYNVFSFHHAYSDVGLAGVYLSTSLDKITSTKKELRDELKKITDGDITKTEVENTKEQLRSRLILGLETTKARVSKLVNDEIYHRRSISIEEISENVSSVTHDEINDIANKFFSDKNILWCSLLPKGG